MLMRKKMLALLLALLLMLSLCSCGGKLKGTYTSEGLFAQTFTFDDNNVTMSAFGLNASGTYKIKDDQIEITYSLLGSDYTWSQPFSKSGSTINIGGTDFKKQ